MFSDNISQNWIVVKRNETQEPFNAEKIKIAISKCFINGLKYPENEARDISNIISNRVLNFLKAQNLKSFQVEDIQRVIIHQLWADGKAEAAEQYTIYREERRRIRTQRNISPEIQKLINEDAKRFSTPLQYYQFISKFSRWMDKDQRRETWKESTNRVFNWFETIPQYVHLFHSEKQWLESYMYDLKASPALRVVQMAGPALERCHVGAYNCAYAPIIDLFSFAELLYVLMQGTGMGFSVEQEYIDRLPFVSKWNNTEVIDYYIEDSTEGWCDALYFGLKQWFQGDDAKFDYSMIRPAGARLKIKGGRASGPKPLEGLLNFVRSTIKNAQGRHLHDIEVHDICCMIGKIVQVGGVRRASCISLSDLDSPRMKEAKHGSWWNTNSQRSMANNSATFNEPPTMEQFIEEWNALVKSRSGERGIFNRIATIKNKPDRRKARKFGTNPCAEIILPPFSFCNLSIAIVRGNETKEELENRVKAATYFGVLQSCCTNFKYIRKDWKENVEDERLIGVDIMGHLDHPLLVPGSKFRKEIVLDLKKVVADTAKDLSRRFNINYSAANTCLKPGGDSGVFFNTTSLSPYFSKYQIRRTRESINSPVCKLLKDQGVPWEPASEDEANLVAFSWPKKNPDNCITRDDLDAIEQLENWLFWKRTWAEHSCSVTIYVKDYEWMKVGAWVWEHFDEITGVCFLPWDNGTYRTAPNEQISKERYEELLSKFPEINWSKLMQYEDEDMTTSAQTYSCTADSCST